MRGVLAGSLALIALHTLVSYTGANDRIGGAFASAAKLVDRFLDPAIPAIPDRSGSPSSSSLTAAAPVARPTLAYPAPAYPG